MPKIRVQETSLEAYFSLVLPNIRPKQKEVVRVFSENLTMDFTSTEIAEELGWRMNATTPRVYELRGCCKRFPLQRPILIESRRRPCRITGNNAMAWQLNPELKRGGYKIG